MAAVDTGWVVAENRLGQTHIGDVDTTAAVPVGTIVQAYDADTDDGRGQGEFIYLQGVASTVAGSVVVFDPAGGTTELLDTDSVQFGPVAVAMAATVADTYGWYMISGQTDAVSLAAGTGAGVQVFGSATAGSVTAAYSAGNFVFGMKFAADRDATAGTTLVSMFRPFVTDNEDSSS